ncbi:hypothetical protein ACLMJK_008551 [Lecanora helva]
MFSYLFLSLSLTAHLSAAQLLPCYDKNGKVVGDVPCDPAANVSACCGASYKCVTSLYCEAGTGFQLMGTCTDPTWNDPECPFQQLNRGDNQFIATLNITDCGDGTACPNPKNKTCCFNKQGVKIITYHNDYLIPTAASGLSSYYSAGGYTVPTTFTSASTVISLPSSSYSTNTTDTPSASTTLPSPPASYPIDATKGPDAPAAKSSSYPGLSSGSRAGIGIGVVVVALVLGAVAFFKYHHYRQRRQHRQTPSDSRESRIACEIPMAKTDGASKENTSPREMQGDPTLLPEVNGRDEPTAPTRRLEMDAASYRFPELGVGH